MLYMKSKKELFVLLDKSRIRLVYGAAVFLVLSFAVQKIFNEFSVELFIRVVLSVLFLLLGLIFLIEGVYLKKLLVVSRGGAYDIYYKKAAFIQGILLFIISFTLGLLFIIFHPVLLSITAVAILLSIIFHFIFPPTRSTSKWFLRKLKELFKK